METVKATKEYTIYKKRSGRFAVKGKNNKWINGLDKAKILVGEKLVKTALAKAPEQAEEAAAAEETTQE